MEREWTESGLKKSMNWRFIEVICFLFIWDHITVQSSRQDPLATEQHVTKQYDWLISDRGPFHHSRSYLTFVEKFHQGFTTRYKIYRWVHFQPVCWCHTVFLRVSFNGFSFLRFQLQKAAPCTFLTRSVYVSFLVLFLQSLPEKLFFSHLNEALSFFFSPTQVFFPPFLRTKVWSPTQLTYNTNDNYSTTPSQATVSSYGH